MSVLALRTDAAVTVEDPDAFRAELLARVAGGARLVTLYGRRDRDAALVTAIVVEHGALAALRTRVALADGLAALTAELPAAHVFERELHEQLGLPIHGHPWLKPVRFEGRDQAAMASYPYFRVEGKEVHEVAVGPIHAGVIEPGSFRFQCYGELVLHLEIQLGYQHRGIEPMLVDPARPPATLAPWVEAIAGDTTIGHAWASAAALELLAARPPEPGDELARAILLELERVAMHLASLAGLAADVAYLPAASTYGRLRTTAINTSMRLTGSRFGRGAVRAGGNRAELSAELHALLRANLAALRADLAIVDDCFVTARTVRHRLVGVGAVAPEVARTLGLVGPAARASGLEVDARVPRRGVYASPALEACERAEGDCFARARVRIDEIGASLAWLAATVDAIPDPTRAWTRRPGPAQLALAPDQLAVAVVEGWRGECVHALETDADGRLVHYKVQDPSLRNWMGLALAVRDNGISDFPICNKSFDLSYCGNDL